MTLLTWVLGPLCITCLIFESLMAGLTYSFYSCRKYGIVSQHSFYLVFIFESFMNDPFANWFFTREALLFMNCSYYFLWLISFSNPQLSWPESFELSISRGSRGSKPLMFYVALIINTGRTEGTWSTAPHINAARQELGASNTRQAGFQEANQRNQPPAPAPAEASFVLCLRFCLPTHIHPY